MDVPAASFAKLTLTELVIFLECWSWSMFCSCRRKRERLSSSFQVKRYCTRKGDTTTKLFLKYTRTRTKTIPIYLCVLLLNVISTASLPPSLDFFSHLVPSWAQGTWDLQKVYVTVCWLILRNSRSFCYHHQLMFWCELQCSKVTTPGPHDKTHIYSCFHLGIEGWMYFLYPEFAEFG